MANKDHHCPKLELNLNEENEIGFKLKIEGTDKEIGSTKPKVRFTITEAKTDRGWIFNAEKGEAGDGITVTIPDMKGVVQEGQDYSGKLEVIMGTRYFTPTEVNIEFIEPLKVEAAITTTKSSTLNEEPTKEKEVIQESPEEPLSVESEIDSIIVKEKKQKEEPTVIKPSAPVIKEEVKRPISYSSLSDKEKEAANKLFLEKCKKLGVKNPQKYFKEGTNYTKKRLRALMAQATRHVIDQR